MTTYMISMRFYEHADELRRLSRIRDLSYTHPQFSQFPFGSFALLRFYEQLMVFPLPIEQRYILKIFVHVAIADSARQVGVSPSVEDCAENDISISITHEPNIYGDCPHQRSIEKSEQP